MKKPDWIDARSACAALGVKPQTLYAYVSRHPIRTKSDPADARASLYALRDIEAVARQQRRPRARVDVARAAIRWGDPVMSTSITEVREGTIWLRGRAIEDCAKHMTLEQVMALLCGVDALKCPTTRARIGGSSTFTRAMKVLAQETEASRPMGGLDPAEIAQDAARMMSLVIDACLEQPLDGAIHERIGAAWGLTPPARNVVRQALVLLSDHELNPSTFAVRVCASTGATLASALLSGMATLSGPKHGGVAGLAMGALESGMEGRFQRFLDDHAEQGAYAYGFGHPLYPDGDPRARYLLRHIPQGGPATKAVRQLSDHLSVPPNIDAALAALSLHFGCPRDAATTIFSIGRMAGWTAHAIEQVQSGQLIRPRATYTPLG
ncbi:MAG: citrate synthase [Pseudomonadota bacterium]